MRGSQPTSHREVGSQVILNLAESCPGFGIRLEGRVRRRSTEKFWRSRPEQLLTADRIQTEIEQAGIRANPWKAVLHMKLLAELPHIGRVVRKTIVHRCAVTVTDHSFVKRLVVRNGRNAHGIFEPFKTCGC